MHRLGFVAALVLVTGSGCGLTDTQNAPTSSDPRPAPADRDLGRARRAVPFDAKRVALVVGNGDYAHTEDLRQAPEDARAMHATLQGLGFRSTLLVNADQRAFDRALVDFAEALDYGAVGFFYYAGHGVQVSGKNYLVPVDAVMAKRSHVDADAVDAREVITKMDAAGSALNVVVLDACRNNPWADRWFSDDKRASAPRGLGQMDAPTGFVVGYATAPHDVASDSGSYAKALQAQLTTPCTSIVDAFLDTHTAVVNETGGDQVPWTHLAVGSEANRFYPAGGDCEPVVATKAPVSPLPSAPVPKERWVSPTGVALRYVPGGTFTMGSPEGEEGRVGGETAHEVTVNGLWVMETEVTQALWQQLMGENPSAIARQFWNGEDGGPCHTYEGVSLVDPTYPVMCIPWNDAVALANRLSTQEGLAPAYTSAGERIRWNRDADGYRLLTEAEWEHAARGGEPNQRYAGTDDPARACGFANVADASAEPFAWSWTHFDCDDGHAALAPVGSFMANGYGVHNMTGNVWEWVWDGYADYPSGSASNPSGPESATHRVVRGGSWVSMPSGARVAFRDRYPPGRRINNVGLRLARPAR